MPIIESIGGSRGFGLLGKPLAVVTGGTLVTTDSTYYYRIFTSSNNFCFHKLFDIFCTEIL